MLKRSSTALDALQPRGDGWSTERITAAREALINSKSFDELLETVGAMEIGEEALAEDAGGGFRLDPTGINTSPGCFWFETPSTAVTSLRVCVYKISEFYRFCLLTVVLML